MASTSKDETVRITSAESKRVTDAERELMKAEFNEKLNAHFLSTRSLEECSKMTNLWSHNCLDPLILRIQKEKKSICPKGTYIYKHEDKYMMVGIWQGRERLFLQDESGKYKVILPWEDIFDIFWETHLKYCHPSSGTLKHILEDEYIVNDFAIKIVCEVCYKCSAAQKPYMRCALDIISLNGIADHAFTQIMICQDMYTGYIHLRPLSIDYKESEICVELLRIFMDFGPPKEVLISSHIFRAAIDQIKHLTTFAPISITVHRVEEDKPRYKRIKEAISKWMNQNEFENWSIACFGVQSYLNNQNKGPGKKSPYEMVFKEIKSCLVEDLKEVEFDSVELTSSSDVNADEDLSVASNVSGRNSAEQASPSPSSPEEEHIISDTIMAGSDTSDDVLIQADEEDPLAIDWAIDM